MENVYIKGNTIFCSCCKCNFFKMFIVWKLCQMFYNLTDILFKRRKRKSGNFESFHLENLPFRFSGDMAIKVLAGLYKVVTRPKNTQNEIL